MDALIAFLNARLDEDDAAAHAAMWDDQSATWTARPAQAHYEQYTVEDYVGDGVVVVAPENADNDGVGQHVARHDPARALREVTAKRSAIAEYQAVLEDLDSRDGREFGDAGYGHALGSSLRGVLKAMASVYSDHPEYQKEWTP